MKWTKGKNFTTHDGYINNQVKWEASDLHKYFFIDLVEDTLTSKCVKAEGWKLTPGPKLEPALKDITHRLVGLPINVAVAFFETYARLENLDFD